MTLILMLLLAAPVPPELKAEIMKQNGPEIGECVVQRLEKSKVTTAQMEEELDYYLLRSKLPEHLQERIQGLAVVDYETACKKRWRMLHQQGNSE